MNQILAVLISLPMLQGAEQQLTQQLAVVGVREAILWIMTLMLTVAAALLAFIIFKLHNVLTQEKLREELQSFRKDLNEDMELLRKDVSVQISSRLPVLFDPHAEKDEK